MKYKGEKQGRKKNTSRRFVAVSYHCRLAWMQKNVVVVHGVYVRRSVTQPATGVDMTDDGNSLGVPGRGVERPRLDMKSTGMGDRVGVVCPEGKLLIVAYGE